MIMLLFCIPKFVENELFEQCMNFEIVYNVHTVYLNVQKIFLQKVIIRMPRSTLSD